MSYLGQNFPYRLWFRKWVDRFKSLRLYKYYSSHSHKAMNEDRMIIFMADGRMKHGGLADRICGIVSAYRYCKLHNIEFRIHFVSPYVLSEILEPTTFDWTISPDEISYNTKDAQPVYLSLYSHHFEKVYQYFNRSLDRIKKKQIHLYTNARCFPREEFSQLFFELFKPVPALQKMIDENLNQLPPHYISLTFRFQQLLGDFREDGFPVLKSNEEKAELMEKCTKCLMQLHEKTNSQILVTSDSITFLDFVKKFGYVYVIKGKMRHMDFSKEKDVDISIDMKSFVDFFLLAKADRLYVSVFPPLYRTGFPLAASFLYRKPVEVVNYV